jgi:hypothetical protein
MSWFRRYRQGGFVKLIWPQGDGLFWLHLVWFMMRPGGSGVGKAVAGGGGLDDVAVEGESVDDRGGYLDPVRRIRPLT